MNITEIELYIGGVNVCRVSGTSTGASAYHVNSVDFHHSNCRNLYSYIWMRCWSSNLGFNKWCSTSQVETVETFSVQIGDVIVIKENVGVINLYSIVLAPRSDPDYD